MSRHTGYGWVILCSLWVRRYTRCTNRGKAVCSLKSVNISPCLKEPCNLHRDTTVNGTITFNFNKKNLWRRTESVCNSALLQGSPYFTSVKSLYHAVPGPKVSTSAKNPVQGRNFRSGWGCSSLDSVGRWNGTSHHKWKGGSLLWHPGTSRWRWASENWTIFEFQLILYLTDDRIF